MFGYVRPLHEELKLRDWEGYQAAYCGLCHALKEECGFAARFVLNYDFLFLTLLLDGETAPATACKRRCAAHPLAPRTCVAIPDAMGLCAKESVILSHYKLLDDMNDEGFAKRLKSRVANLMLARSYRKARRALPDFDAKVKTNMEALGRMEAEGCSSIDRTADAFANLLATAAPSTGNDRIDRPRFQLLYHLGRWIYLADAADDLAEDKAKGRYNPIVAQFGSSRIWRK